MATPPTVEQIQRAANMCAIDSVDELRTLVPVQVPPDSQVCTFFFNIFFYYLNLHNFHI